MKTYLVNIKINIGDFEKHTTHFVKALTPESAGRRAILGECHEAIGDGATLYHDGDECEEDSGGLYYSVYKVTEVQPNHVPTLEIYLG